MTDMKVSKLNNVIITNSDVHALTNTIKIQCTYKYNFCKHIITMAYQIGLMVPMYLLKMVDLIKKWLISLLTDSLLVLVKKKFFSQLRKLKPSKDPNFCKIANDRLRRYSLA